MEGGGGRGRLFPSHRPHPSSLFFAFFFVLVANDPPYTPPPIPFSVFPFVCRGRPPLARTPAARFVFGWFVFVVVLAAMACEQVCLSRDTHEWGEDRMSNMRAKWEPTPEHMILMDVKVCEGSRKCTWREGWWGGVMI